MEPDSDLIFACLGSNIMGVKLLPAHWNRFNLLRSVLRTKSSSVLLLYMYVYTYISMRMSVCMYVF